MLPQLWAAVQEVRESGDWTMLHVPKAQLVEHEAHLAKSEAHELPALDVPAWPALVSESLSKPEVSAPGHLPHGELLWRIYDEMHRAACLPGQPSKQILYPDGSLLRWRWRCPVPPSGP